MSNRSIAAGSTAQAWVELRAEDPEALSALAVARARLRSGEGLRALRRLRLIEIRGHLPERATLEEVLHHSTRIYNPHKERCTLRMLRTEPAPVERGDVLVKVTDRGELRHAAAERWWLHETGSRAEVREGVVWVLSFESGAPAEERAAELASTRDRAHGLLSNPHSQDHSVSAALPPLPWLTVEAGMSVAGGGS